MKNLKLLILILTFSLNLIAAIEAPLKNVKPNKIDSFTDISKDISKYKNLPKVKIAERNIAPIAFDVPVTYNRQVQTWIHYFQTNGKGFFKKWLERSYRYMPLIHQKLKENNMPLDLFYIAMIESGFSLTAKSHASAVGPWQFIEPTGKRFKLKINDWIDERQDIEKSTDAAIKYMKKLYAEFNSWYLVAAAYNTGEGRVRRLIKKYKTKNFWKLSKQKGFVSETRNYIPKFLAAMLIAKSPKLYGFRNLNKWKALKYEYFFVPSGTDLNDIADKLMITRKSLKTLNSELKHSYIPPYVRGHHIKIPKGSSYKLSKHIKIVRGEK